MIKIGYHASHEQFSPKFLVTCAQRAEKNGFDLITSSDHFHPWTEKDAHSGFAWSWLGAAMQVVQLEFGIVTSPAPRYHPAIIAQAVATLNQMFDNRLWIAAGSGQAMNESITADVWPDKDTRNKRLAESVSIMRKLWSGDEVNADGSIKLANAKLYTLPTALPQVIGAALSDRTASWMATWAEGLITINHAEDTLKKIVSAFRAKNKTGVLAIKIQTSFAENISIAEKLAWESWRNNVLGTSIQAELSQPKFFDEAGQFVRVDDMKEHVLLGTAADTYIQAIHKYREMGFSKIIFHNVNKNQDSFIDMMGREVLPYVR
ncbi:TIGR03885 family FMN-dependent LLM class oxidoreductase [Sphingobacterium paludis]|uniref:Putative non-F420 flavinoid oxidoreductase n=1 Tax=Sphingobacterium paludis TaxID=1476465 RepID=A0A4R7CWV0_9SPHI|nr:TIGR03885 family FMN-dependent LLM class oxidoreductase [Sphingobacterium paludis]TDS12979.1 putative non-F420 flavinoid oxidoreductase [Sphingobacterium paludis]